MNSTAHIQVFSQKINDNLVWDISQSNFVSTIDLSSSLPVGLIPSGIFVDKSGTKLFVLDKNTKEIYHFDFSIVWDVSTLVFNKKSQVLSNVSNAIGLRFNDAGSKVYVMSSIPNGNDNPSVINSFSLSTPWDLSSININVLNTMSLTRTTGKEWNDKDFYFSNDGYYVFYIYASDDIYNISNTTFLRVYRLSSPFNLSSLTTIGSGAVSKLMAFDSDAIINRIIDVNKDGSNYNWNEVIEDFSNTYFLASQPTKIDHRDTTFNKTKFFDGLNNECIDFPTIQRFYVIDNNRSIKQYNTNFFIQS